MIREIKLLQYLPPFVQEYREMQKIMETEEPEFQLVADESEVIKNNQFISTCDEDGISRFESLLHITPSADDSLQARISRVITRWNSSIPYTYKALLQKLKVLCGEGNYDVIPDFDNYEMTVNTYLPLAGQTNELDYLLSYIIPANIKVTSLNTIVHNITGKLYAAGGTVTHRKFTIDSKMNTEHTLQGEFRYSGTVIRRIQRSIDTAT